MEERMEHDIELMDLVPPKPHDSRLSGGHTPGSDEGNMTLKKLTDLCTTLLQKVLDPKTVKTAQAKEIAGLKKRVTKLKQRQSSRISGFYPFRVGSSKRHNLDKDVDTEMIEDNGNGEKGGSTEETVTTARTKVSTAKPKTPPTIETLFDDEDVTIADTLVKMKNQKAKEKGIAFKDADDSARPIRSITTLKPLLTIDPKDKSKGILQEPKPAALAEMYDEVQAQIDVDHKLAVRLTNEEQENYTVEERSKLLVEFFERRKKQLVKERTEEIKSKPPTKTQLRNLMMTYLKHTVSEDNEKRIESRKKRAASLSIKHKSPKKQKVNDQESKDTDKEHGKCLKVIPDDEKAIDYETLDVKSLIVDFESKVLGTNEADVLDLHKIIMERFSANDPEGYDLILWGDLKTLVESSEDDEIWRNQQDWRLLSWKLYETCGVHTLMLDDSLVSINMFVEKRLKKSKVFGYILLAIYGDRDALDNPCILSRRSLWTDIIQEFDTLSRKGIDLHSHMKKEVVNGKFKDPFPIALFRRAPRRDIEEEQLHLLADRVVTVIMLSINDRWACKVFGHVLKECSKNISACKLRFVDDDENPLVSTGIADSDSEVKMIFDETANLRLSTSGKDGSDKGYGTNSLLEHWRDSYPDNDDYDPYDDDMYENHDMSEHLQSNCDDLDITVRDKKKK
nr:hypothetical protein [Tanacetum cinerariifolium]